MTRSTSSFWETKPESHTLSRPMCSQVEREIESKESTSGSIQPKNTTLTLFYGTCIRSCKMGGTNLLHVSVNLGWLELGRYRPNFTFLKLNCRFFVDDIPIRVFKNSKDLGVKFPFDQPMKIYSSLWNADDWATQGGRVKTDWSKAPFVASYRGFHIDGCEASATAKLCATQGKKWWDQKAFRDLDGRQYRRLAWVRKKYTIDNYCTDRKRFAKMAPECVRDRDVWCYLRST